MEKKHFPDFYRKNMQRVYRFLFYRTSGNKETAEDLTQDVFLKAFAAFDRYDPAISQTSWILTIARNHLINHVHKQHGTVDLQEIENTMWDRVDWSVRMTLSYDERRLMEAIGKLPPEDAEIVRLKYLEGWKYEEMVERIGKNAGAIRVQAHRALKTLKKLLKQM